jgi:hypothetical protein
MNVQSLCLRLYLGVWGITWFVLVGDIVIMETTDYSISQYARDNLAFGVFMISTQLLYPILLGLHFWA